MSETRVVWLAVIAQALADRQERSGKPTEWVHDSYFFSDCFKQVCENAGVNPVKVRRHHGIVLSANPTPRMYRCPEIHSLLDSPIRSGRRSKHAF